ncbi:MAG: BamA/TamA family outer membrane protein [Gemmatimonadaceae bacterium]
MTTNTLWRASLATVFGFLSLGREAVGQTTPPSTAPVVNVVPGPEYEAGRLTRKLLGDGWRDVWTTPLDVPVLDLARYAGGLKVVRSGGGMQSRTLHFEETGGWREYVFRSVNKFPVGKAIPRAIRDTPFGAIIEDQVSTLFPASALMVPPLLEAIGVLHVKPELFLMPDDPRLGVHRDTFATMLGLMELSPQEAPKGEAGFAGSREIKGGEDFLEDIRSSRSHRLDEREFLAVRLVDFLINDTDRSADNIRFARYGDDSAYRWRPLPRDRDRAFIDARGWLIKYVVKPLYPKLIDFGPEFRLDGLVYESHNLDRRLLQRLARADVDEVALRVQKAIDDRVIEGVVQALPARWRTQTGADERLRTNLRIRRDQLPNVARDFYQWLATEVDVHGTDKKERVVVDRHVDGRVTVTVTGPKDTTAEPFSRRTFLPRETNEVRIYLHDDDDVALVRGAPGNAIKVRIIGGDGDDLMTDSAGGDATRFYDSNGENEFITTEGTRVSIEEWDPPQQGAGIRFDAPWRPDWGTSKGWGPLVDYADGAGVIVGFGPRLQSNGFRRLPYRWKAGANLLLGLGNGRPGVSIDADYRAENSPLAVRLAARATKFESFRFYGFGNDTDRERTSLVRVDEDLVAVEPALIWHIGWRSREGLGSGLGDGDDGFPGLRPLTGRLEAGPLLYWTKVRPAPGSPFVTEAGAQDRDASGRVGVRLGLALDRTPGGAAPDRGWRFQANLAGFPPLWNVDQSFSTAAGVGSMYFPLPGDRAHVAFRTGGAFASGAFLVQHAPTIGGRETVRGFDFQRFTGESSAFGSAEIRVPAGTLPLFLRWRTGVFGLVDAGRVWFDDAAEPGRPALPRSDGGWHTGVGAGFWLSALGQTVSVAFVRGEVNRVYLQRGLSF